MTPAAMACAALLLGHPGDLPAWVWINAKPGATECERAMTREREWFDAAFKRPTCHAVTYSYPGLAIVVAREDRPYRTFVVEGIRIIEARNVEAARNGTRLTSAQVYALADRWRECP